MKNFFLLLLFFSVTIPSFSQNTAPDSTKREYKNVVGVDATAILRQFFNLNTSTFVNYPYMISYRRIFKSNTIRVNIGGDISDTKNVVNDSTYGNQTRTNFNAAMGAEHYCYLSKRWNFYFGADAIFNYRSSKSESLSSASVTQHQSSITYGYGLSPLLGLQFKINSRLSIATETSYDIIYATSTSYITNTPTNLLNFSDRNVKSTSIETQFNAPATLNLRIHF